LQELEHFVRSQCNDRLQYGRGSAAADVKVDGKADGKAAEAKAAGEAKAGGDAKDGKEEAKATTAAPSPAPAFNLDAVSRFVVQRSLSGRVPLRFVARMFEFAGDAGQGMKQVLPSSHPPSLFCLAAS
jgi:hypothetical protein